MKKIILSLFIVSQTLYGSPIEIESLFLGQPNFLLNDKDLKKSVLFLFKPNCSSCRRMVKEMRCLSTNQIYFISFPSSLPSIQKEARLLGLYKNSFQANKKFLKSYGITKYDSPLLVGTNSLGVRKYWLGENNCKEIKAFIES